MGDIFGRNPVMEALKSNRTINKIWLAKGEQKGSVREIVALAKESAANWTKCFPMKTIRA